MTEWELSFRKASVPHLKMLADGKLSMLFGKPGKFLFSFPFCSSIYLAQLLFF